MLGLCQTIDYEGQAAIRLEHAQDMAETGAYACPLDTGRDPAVLDTLVLFDQVRVDWEHGEPVGRVARRFHLGLIAGLAAMARHMATQTSIRRVARKRRASCKTTPWASLLPASLLEAGLTPLLCHRLVPANDAPCVSLGAGGLRCTGNGQSRHRPPYSLDFVNFI